MIQQKMYAKIAKWIYEYLAGYTCKFIVCYVGYSNMSNYFGMCTWDYSTNNTYKFYIYINDIFRHDDFITEVILWHEFAHLMDVVKNGDGEHDKGWIKEWMRKPLMTLPAYIAILPIVLYRFIMEDVKK